MEYSDRTLNARERLGLAVRTLTPLRVPPRGRVSDGDLRESAAFYPLVGLLVGLPPAGVLLLPLPDLSCAALALAAWVAASGAVHLGGWARACDAALTPGQADEAVPVRERRLRILRDHALGTFGAAGLFLLLLAKWTALVHAPAYAPLVAAVLARWALVHALRTYVPAREDGPGARMAGPVPLWRATLLAVALIAPVTFAAPEASLTGIAVAAGTAAALVTAAFLVDRLGGITFGAAGASAEAAELAVLWAFLPWG
jgi:adenosylcobinamide-GDP ribazoletransferase